jgi:hypothetical protein
MSERFEDEDLRAAYATIATDATATHRPDCPSSEELLAAARGEGSPDVRLRVLDRGLRCAACRRELALLHAVSGVGARERGAARLYAWRRWVPLAAAAVLLLSVGLLTINQSPADDVVRGLGTDLALLAPEDGASHNAGPITLVWQRVTDALRYTVEVDAADGSVLYRASTTDTLHVVPDETQLVSETRWWVRAHMKDGSERRSDARTLYIR